MGEHLLRFKRADDHLQQLEIEIRSWVKTHPCTITTKRDSEPGVHLTLASIDKIPLDPIALIISDILHNLRSGLDSLAYALAEKYSGTLSPQVAKKSEFPIFGDIDGQGVSGKGLVLFNGGLSKIGGVDPAAQTVIESLQPYHDGASFVDHPLWRLHELNRIDKHRLLHPVAAHFRGAALDLIKSINLNFNNIRSAGAGFIDTRLGVIEQETIIARYKLPPIDPQQEMHAHFFPPIEIAFGSIVEGQPAVAVLAGIHKHIVQHVLPPLEVFL
jgi:hypothetical protein